MSEQRKVAEIIEAKEVISEVTEPFPLALATPSLPLPDEPLFPLDYFKQLIENDSETIIDDMSNEAAGIFQADTR